MCVNVSSSCDSALPLSNILEIHLQMGSVLCMSLRVSFLSSGGMLTVSLVDAVVGSAGVVLAMVCILLWVFSAETQSRCRPTL